MLLAGLVVCLVSCFKTFVDYQMIERRFLGDSSASNINAGRNDRSLY